MKVSFIATVLNEENNIKEFLHSLVNQSRKADETIIVDGGSSDRTVAKIKNYSSQFKVLVKKGNRAVGRNEAIRQASGDIIVCSDAGCILAKDWTKNIIEPFNDSKVDVVAGYYKGKAENSFERCIVPYFLVMEDKVAPDNFLPATRSMAFRKSAWKKVGGFPEELINNEDYAFAKKLKKNNAKIVFQKKALIYWLPKRNLKEAAVAFYRFAKGDAEASIFRPKAILLCLRYFAAFWLLIFFFVLKLNFLIDIFLILLVLYIFWAIIKSYRYVRDWRAFYYLPLIQMVSDMAVILGTIRGLFK